MNLGIQMSRSSSYGSPLSNGNPNVLNNLTNFARGTPPALEIAEKVMRELVLRVYVLAACAPPRKPYWRLAAEYGVAIAAALFAGYLIVYLRL